MRGPTAHDWAVPYRALRPWSLVTQVAVLAVAEVLLFLSYSGHDSRFHWAAHFLVALIATTAWLSVYLLVAARPAPLQVGTVLVFHLVAMFPDLLFFVGVPHYPWMDVFFAHVAVHYLPGGDTTWLALALVVVAAYTWLVTRWLRARHHEAALGMAPGIGIGGSAVVRAQRDPHATLLAHRHAGTPRDGPAGDPVLLLHGLGGTGAQWSDVAELLAAARVPSLRVDLLGHGASLDIGTRFTAADQVAALLRLLDHHGLGSVVVVAHSYGCAVAAGLAEMAPGRVRRVVLVCPPAYVDDATVRQRLGARSWMARRTVEGAPVANLVCGAMCLSRGAIRRLAPRVRSDLDPDVARGGVEHSYPAYWDAVATLVRENPLPRALRHPAHPTSVLVAADDATVHPDDVRALGVHADVEVTEVPGQHELTVTQPQRVATFVVRAVGGVRRG